MNPDNLLYLMGQTNSQTTSTPTPGQTDKVPKKQPISMFTSHAQGSSDSYLTSIRHVPKSNVSAESFLVYNDDEPLPENLKKEGVMEKQKNGHSELKIEIKAQRSAIQMERPEFLPAMLSISANSDTRTSVDLICVIDTSGSMLGEPLALVKDTLTYLLQTLTPMDRLSIISFSDSGKRISKLKRITPQNMSGFQKGIKSLNAAGGTNIMAGLDLALKTIRQRKMANTVTSIFLLSDGRDEGAEQRVKEVISSSLNSKLGIFSLYSFGFGTEHDEQLMTNLCKLKEGSFYFIKELSTLDQAFSNALGGVISLAARKIEMKLKLVAKNIVKDIKISKVYGQMWKQVKQDQYEIKMQQLMSGIQKDYVLELQIPKIEGILDDHEQQQLILEGELKAEGLDSEAISLFCDLRLVLLMKEEPLNELAENVDVVQNYLRMKATQCIRNSLQKAEKQEYDEARQAIEDMITMIKDSKFARKQKMAGLIQDLQLIKSKCVNRNVYLNQGRKWMKNAQVSHSYQNSMRYFNGRQERMFMDRVAYKKKVGKLQYDVEMVE